MDTLAVTLITLGGLFILGLVTDVIGRHTSLPRVTLLISFGFLIGPSALDLIPQHGQALYPGVTHVALAMVGFLLGGKLSLESLRQHGASVLWIAFAVTLITTLVVFAGLIGLGSSVVVALLVGVRSGRCHRRLGMI